MKKISAILLCLVLVVSLAACGSSEEELKARYDEGYKAGYEKGAEAGREEGAKDGYKTGYDEGKKAGYDEGAKAGNEESYQVGYDEGLVVGKDEGYKAGKDEGYSTGYDEGSKTGQEEGYKAGYEAGLEEGKASARSGGKTARFSGAFTASVGKLVPDYVALPGNPVAVVHFFQDGPFLLYFGEDMTGKLAEGKAYVFEFRAFEVEIPDGETDPDIKDYSDHIMVTGYRAAKDDETGMASIMPSVEIKTK